MARENQGNLCCIDVMICFSTKKKVRNYVKFMNQNILLWILLHHQITVTNSQENFVMFKMFNLGIREFLVKRKHRVSQINSRTIYSFFSFLYPHQHHHHHQPFNLNNFPTPAATASKLNPLLNTWLRLFATSSQR